MRALKLAPTISAPELSDFIPSPDILKKIVARNEAKVVEGYVITTDIEVGQIHKFFAEVNIDNDRLWPLVKTIVSTFPDEAALIYHHIDDEPTFGYYVDKYDLMNELEKYNVELTQDGFLKFGIIYHHENNEFLEEVFVEKAKYIQCWGMDKDKFTGIMNQFDLYPIKGLKFIDEFPLKTEALRKYCNNCLETENLLKILDGLYKIS